MNVDGTVFVVAIHIESTNDIPDDVSLTEASEDTSAEVIEMRDEISVISNTYRSTAQGLIIKNCHALRALLVSNGVSNL